VHGHLGENLVIGLSNDLPSPLLGLACEDKQNNRNDGKEGNKASAQVL
jgi:hypothetical protein